MNKLILTALVGALVLFFLLGCGGYKEGMRQPDPESFVWFSGDLTSAVAIIDNGSPIQLDAPAEKDPEGKTLFRITPGKHEIVVTRNGQLIVHRSIMVGAGAAKEIALP